MTRCAGSGAWPRSSSSSISAPPSTSRRWPAVGSSRSRFPRWQSRSRSASPSRDSSAARRRCNPREQRYVALAHVPKATIQAVYGAVPLLIRELRPDLVPDGETLLLLAVLAIVATAPLGAIVLEHGAARSTAPPRAGRDGSRGSPRPRSAPLAGPRDQLRVTVRLAAGRARRDDPPPRRFAFSPSKARPRRECVDASHVPGMSTRDGRRRHPGAAESDRNEAGLEAAAAHAGRGLRREDGATRRGVPGRERPRDRRHRGPADREPTQ